MVAAAAVDGLAPRWVVRPAAIEDLSRVVALAHEAGLAVVPRGSGSALEMGAPPSRVDVVVDLRGLARILEYSPDDLTVTVEAGVTAGQLAALLDAHQQFLPLDPPGAATRTLGGLTATNAIGPLRCRYGALRDLLLGVRFVQADGVITWGGAKVVKSVTGYDIPKLMVGSLGTLGILAELTLRLHPRPEHERTWLATFPSLAAAQKFASAVLDSSIQPARLQLLDGRAARDVAGVSASAAAAISIGSVEIAVTEQGNRLESLATNAVGSLRPVTGEFWSALDRVLAAGHVVLRVGVPAASVAHAVGAVHDALAAGPAPIVTACAATGAVTAVADGADGAALPRVIDTLRSFVATLDGHVMVLRAPRSVRSAIDPWGPIDPAAFEIMRGLKTTFDPKATLNPGRFVGGL